MANPGPPPVARSPVAPETRMTVPQQNYLTIVDTLKANGGAEAKALRAMFGGDRRLMDQFLAMCMSALAGRADILQAEPLSLVQAIKDAASLGLVPFSGDGSIIVYGQTAKFMPEWRGYIKRIRNSREVQDLDCQLVYAGDLFELELGTEPRLRHVPVLPEKDPEGNVVVSRGDYRGAYAWALMPSGKYIIEWMTTDDINYVRDTWGNKQSRSGKPLPWETSWGEMARKTVIRRLAKRLPSAAVDKLLQIEQAHDEAQEQLRLVAEKVDTGLAEVQRLALAAVGQIGPGEPSSEAPSGDEKVEPDTGTTPEKVAPPEGPEKVEKEPDPGVDPNVQAAMLGHTHSTEPGWKIQRGCPQCESLIRPNLGR